jgi:DNA polymerase-4
VRFADFQTITRSLTLPEPTNITQELVQAGTELLATKLPQHHLPVRLLGFGVKGFDDTDRSQRQLFDEPDRERHRQLDRVADQISERFGKLAIRRGGGADQND